MFSLSAILTTCPAKGEAINTQVGSVLPLLDNNRRAKVLIFFGLANFSP